MLGLRLADGGTAQSGSWWDRAYLSLQAAGLAEWSAVVGQTFALAGAGGSHRLKVVAVTAFSRSGRRPASLGRSQAFSVAFEAVTGNPLPAGDHVYQLIHNSYPALPIHLGAPFRLGRKTRLIAVFN